MKLFSSVASLKLATLKAGTITKTKGYYEAGDGGQARYLIKTAVDYAGTPDEYGDHTLANGNVAVLQQLFVLRSADNTLYKLVVDNSGILSTEELTSP